MTEKELILYTTPNGKESYTETLEELDIRLQALISARLDRFTLGNTGNFRWIEPEKEILELKMPQDGGFRIYLGKLGANQYLLLNVGKKGKQKKDLKQARNYFDEYKQRA